MNIPPAGLIESAVDQIDPNGKPEKDEASELVSAIGGSTATKLGINFPLSPEFLKGYQIGLQVARQMLAGSMELAVKGINPEILL
jgi:hypothetical protein